MRENLQNGVWDMAFSHDGKALLVGERRGGCELLSVPRGTSLGACAREDNVTAVAFSPDGKEFVTSGGFNGELYVEEFDDKRCAPGVGVGEPGAKPCRPLAGPGQTVWSVGFAPDGGSIAFGNKRTAEDPKGYGPLEQVFTLKHKGGYALSLGGEAKIGSDFIRAVHKSGDYELRTRFGQRLGSETKIYDEELQVWKKGMPHRVIRLSSESGYVHKSFTLTGDGHVISGAEDGYLTMHSAETGAKEVDFVGHAGDVWAVAVSRDNRLLVSGSSDQTVRLWDIRTGTNLLTVFISKDYEWVASTPEGYYTSSLNGDKYIGWMYRAAGEQAPQFYRASQFQKVYYRPKVVVEYLKTSEYLQRPDIRLALDQANEREDIQIVTNMNVADPGRLADSGDPVKFTEALPPRIKLAAHAGPRPGNELETTSPVLTLKFAVESPAGLPITDVGVFLNGVRQRPSKGADGSTGSETKIDVEIQVPLEQAENTLSIVASNERATSSPEVLKVLYKPASGDSRPQSGPQPTASPTPDARPGERPAARRRGALPVRFEAASLSVPAPPRPAETPEIQVVSPASAPETVEERTLTLDLRVDFKRPCPVPGQMCNVVRATLDDVELTPSAFDRAVARMQLHVKPKNDESENTLRITASNGEAESAPVEWRFNFRPRIADKPNLIFLGIGIQEFRHFEPPLNFARRDAEKMLEFIQTQDESGPHGQAAFYKKVIPKLIPDSEATFEAMHDGLTWVNQQTTHDNDVRVVFISTHGGVGATNDQYYLYSYEQEAGKEATRSLNLVDLWAALSKGRGKTLLFIDACRERNPEQGQSIQNIIQFVKNINADYNKGSNIIPFLAAGPNEASVERGGEISHGVFTYALLQGLNGKADGVAPELEPKNGLIEWWELDTWVKLLVPKRLYDRQHPQVLEPDDPATFPERIFRAPPYATP